MLDEQPGMQPVRNSDLPDRRGALHRSHCRARSISDLSGWGREATAPRLATWHSLPVSLKFNTVLATLRKPSFLQ